jgi:glucokinase
MSNIYHSIGIKRFIFIGGFCCAVGQQYLQSLNQVVKKHDWLGLSVDAMENMCQLGALDDDHSLIGMGNYLMEYSYNE